MIATLLILTTPPVVGKAYTLKPILGDGMEQTAVYRGERVIHERKMCFDYTYRLGEFVNEATGELLVREIEINEAGYRQAIQPHSNT